MIDLASLPMDEVQIQESNTSEGWRTITITDFGEPTQSRDGEGVNVRLYYTGFGEKERFHNIHLNPKKTQSYSININMIAQFASVAMGVIKEQVIHQLQKHEINLVQCFNKSLNVQVEAYFGKQKDSDFLEIKRFLGFGEKKPASRIVPSASSDDVPF